MKKIYLLMMLFFTSTVMGQTPIITMIMDGDCTGGSPKVLEVYAQGTVDFTNYSLEKQSNGGAWGTTYDLSPIGTITDDFVYIYADNPSFATEFPNVTNTHIAIGSVMSVNGDDGLRIIENVTSTVIDTYGVEAEHGDDTSWEYENGYAKRNNNTGPDAVFDEANWTFFNGGLDDLCETTTYEVITNAGSYTNASGPTILTSATTVTGFLQFTGTPSAEQTVSVSGTELTADIEVTVNTGDYEISTTSGSGFGTSITLPSVEGTVTSTPIYVRLNGDAVANPSNGDLLITSTDASDVTVILEGEITAPDPTLTVSETALTGFSHLVGTPSEADSFLVAGFNLTDDVVITAPENFEVSTSLNGTYDETATYTNSGGSVVSSKVYVRLNGPTMNLMQVGDVIVSTNGATDKIVALDGETLDFVVSTIAEVTEVDADGVGTSNGNFVTLTGVVHCDNFRNSGYDLTLIDSDNDGINIYSSTEVNGTMLVEGDEITIDGEINQFNGLTQITPLSITILSQGAALQSPTVVTALDESTESSFVTLENLTLVNGETVWPDNGNIDVTDGTNTYSVRIPSASALANTTAPSGLFNLSGIGKQYDPSSPFDSGYQLFPCSVTPLCDVDVTTTVVETTISANATGLSYQWINCADDSEIDGETEASFTVTENGSYAVIITDGTCVDQSECVTFEHLSVSTEEFAGVSVYPNPVSDVLNITNENGILESVEVVSASGSVVFSSTAPSSDFTVNTASLNAGVYFVNVLTASSVKTFKVVK